MTMHVLFIKLIKTLIGERKINKRPNNIQVQIFKRSSSHLVESAPTPAQNIPNCNEIVATVIRKEWETPVRPWCRLHAG